MDGQLEMVSCGSQQVLLANNELREGIDEKWRGAFSELVVTMRDPDHSSDSSRWLVEDVRGE